MEAIGIDEIQYRRGHRYLTMIYQIDGQIRRLLWVGQNRTTEALETFFDLFGDEILPTLNFVCSDMWKPYWDVIRARAGEAVHILDRYHIMAKINNAIDEIRAGEAKRLKADGYGPVLKHSRWCLLKRQDLTSKETVKLREVLQYKLRPCGPTCHVKSSSGSGVPSPRLGPGSSWASGVPVPCKAVWNR